MPCYHGKVVIVRNEGTIIFGHIWENSPSSTSVTTTGPGESTVEEEALESAESSSVRRGRGFVRKARKRKRR
ncbi:hypothetical protein [Paenibacillus sp. PAMC21692]|uniref:hypothetical protein n=1 Tax=Paenibacillus sp. PAMC21692 TaxID=2762320 RepID=UPI00164D731C|nr:hypothetical protein [Paenibacillus sp. PAMC21692]QNK59023.1 hypothetical protein H7F31_09240 [Paenibacillus sp. PAMC21692]